MYATLRRTYERLTFHRAFETIEPRPTVCPSCFGTAVCFGPRRNAVENDSNRTTYSASSHITPHFAKSFHEYLEGSVAMAHYGIFTYFIIMHLLSSPFFYYILPLTTPRKILFHVQIFFLILFPWKLFYSNMSLILHFT